MGSDINAEFGICVSFSLIYSNQEIIRKINEIPLHLDIYINKDGEEEVKILDTNEEEEERFKTLLNAQTEEEFNQLLNGEKKTINFHYCFCSSDVWRDQADPVLKEAYNDPTPDSLIEAIAKGKKAFQNVGISCDQIKVKCFFY